MCFLYVPIGEGGLSASHNGGEFGNSVHSGNHEIDFGTSVFFLSIIPVPKRLNSKNTCSFEQSFEYAS